MTSFWCFYCWLWPESVYQYSVSTFNFEQAFVSRVWKTSHNVLKTQKAIYFFRNKSCKAYFIQRFIIAPNWNKLWTNDHTMNILKGRRKLFYGGGMGGAGGGWVKMSATMVGQRQKIQKKNTSKFKISYLELFFWKYYYGHATLLYSSTRSNGHHQSFFLIFRFSSRKSQSQQKLAKKITHFTIQFRSKCLTHFTNLNSLDIENNMLPQHIQKPFWL